MKKKNTPDTSAFVQGYASAYFDYVLANDQVTDNDYIASCYLRLLEMFAESNVDNKFMALFFAFTLEEEVITGRHLDKFGAALQHFALTTDDPKKIANIDWTMKQVDGIYTRFKQSRNK